MLSAVLVLLFWIQRVKRGSWRTLVDGRRFFRFQGTRYPIRTFLSGFPLLFCLACGSGEPPTATLPATVYAQSGQTVKQAVDSLPPTGGIVILGAGTWPSGYNASFISKPNITIQGSGIPQYNSNFTAMTAGTIVLGRLTASTGADYFTVQDLGVDVGSAYVDANHGGVPLDGLGIFNNGQVIGAKQVQSPKFENVSCLGYSTLAPVHCMIVENVNEATVRNVTTVYNSHGLVIKGTGVTVDGVLALGHGLDSIIVKSDNYAPAGNVQISHFKIGSLLKAGDTKGMILEGIGAGLRRVTISMGNINDIASWGIEVQGADSTTPANEIHISDVTIDYLGGSPADEYCLQFVQYVSDVSISNLDCSNMWAGVRPYLPSSGAFTGFRVADSAFTNIATNAIETYGHWNIMNSTFDSVVGNGIYNPFGVTEVSGNTFNNIGGSDMDAAGGTFVTVSAAGRAHSSGE